MRIERIVITRFGALQEVSIELPDAGVTVLFGPNEAGKSTLSTFVRSVFFGFPRKTAGVNAYQPPDGGMRAGRLDLRTSDGQPLIVERREQHNCREGMPTVFDPTGSCEESPYLPFADADRKSAQSLFFFDPDSLRSLDRDALRSRIVGAALGSWGVNPVDILNDLDARIKQRTGTAKKFKDSSIVPIVTELRKMDEELRVLRDRPQQYFQACDRLERLRIDRENLSEELASVERESDDLEQLLDKREHVERLLYLRDEMNARADARTFPADGIQRLDREMERRYEAHASLHDADQRLKRLRAEYDAAPVDDRILSHAAEISALTEDAGIMRARQRELSERRAEIRASHRRFMHALSELGATWDEGRLFGCDHSIEVEAHIKSFAAEKRRLLEESADCDRRLTEINQELGELHASIEAKDRLIAELREACAAHLTEDKRNALAEWREHDRGVHEAVERLNEFRTRIDELNGEQKAIQASRDELRDRFKRVTRTCAGTAVAVMGVGAIVAPVALVAFDARFWLGIGIPFGTTAAIVALIASIYGMSRRSMHRESASLGERLQTISAERSQIVGKAKTLRTEALKRRRRMDELGKRALGRSGIVTEDVTRAERLSIAAEPHVMRMHGEQAALGIEREQAAKLARHMEGLQERRKEIAEAEADFEHRWSQFSESHGWDPTIEPAAGEEIVKRVRTLKSERAAISREQEVLDRLQQEWEHFGERARTCAEACGLPWTDRDEAPALVKGLSDALDRNRGNQRTRTDLRQRITEWEDRRNELLFMRDRSIAAVENLFRLASVQDEESFRRVAQRHGEYIDMERETGVLVSALMSAIRVEEPARLFEIAELIDWSEKLERFERLKKESDSIRGTLDDKAVEMGRLKQEIESMEHEDRIDRLRADREELLTRLSRGVQDWKIHALARKLLEQTLHRYETEKQPRILQRASEMFSLMTANAFSRVHFLLKSDRIFAERCDGTRVTEENLSRGAHEQLYLALRLANLAVMRETGARLPVIVDEILVNFDRTRAARTAELMERFADETGYQVLFFTCHEATAELFRQNAEVIELPPLSMGSNRDIDELHNGIPGAGSIGLSGAFQP